VSVRRITFGDVEDAAFVADIDEAIARLQGIAGIEDGGVASVVFSGFDWENAMVISRMSRISQWLTVERSYEVE